MSDTAKCTIQVFFEGVKLSSDLAVTREEAERVLSTAKHDGHVAALKAVPTDRDIEEQYLYVAPTYCFYTIFTKRETASNSKLIRT